MSGVRAACVDVLEHDDARVLAQPPVQLPVADVERDDASGAALQHDVGEAAGGGADVEALATLDGDLKGVQCVSELQSAAADVGVIGRDERDVGGVVHGRARLGDRLPVHRHLAGEDQRPRPFSRGRQLPIEQ